MAVKLLAVDVNRPVQVTGLDGYRAVEILFRDGRDPVGRVRLPCAGDSAALDLAALPLPRSQRPQHAELAPGALPSISVAICTRDRLASLQNVLRTLARQDLSPCEILVVDNGRDPSLRDAVRETLPAARTVRERRAGLDFARNRALQEARGDVIAFVDDDVEVDAGFVRSVAEAFATLPEAGAVTGLILPLELETPAQELFEASGGFARGFVRRVLPRDGQRILGMHVPLVSDSLTVGSGCNMAFRTALLRQLGGFDEALDTGSPLPGGGDLDAIYRVLRSGAPLVYEPRALVRHRHRPELEGLRDQLVGYRRALAAFLVKSLLAERGPRRLGIAAFLAFRSLKDFWRLGRGLLGRDPLPLGILFALVLAGFSGLGSYHASRARLSGFERHTGGRRRGPFGQTADLLRYRQLIWNLASRDLKVKYQRSWLGFLWTLINPVVTVAILVAVFTFVIRIQLDHYWAFLLSGYFAWNFFSQTLGGGVQSAVGSAYMTRSAYFPQETLIVAAVLARLVEFLAELMIVMLALAIFHHHGVPASFAVVGALVPILFVLVLGASLPLVTMSVYFHDAVQAIPLAVTALFYVSPVFYNLDMVPEAFRPLYVLNPMAGLLDAFHEALYWGRMPEPGRLLGLSALCLAIAVAGYAVFNWRKREFAEIV